jgi:hypothetical protein
MARTLITNISGFPLGLPLPYVGILNNGESTIVAETSAEVIAFFGGGSAVRNLWAINEVNDANPLGPYTRQTAGNAVAEAQAAATIPTDFNGQRLENVGAPVAGTDAATKAYVDAQIGGTAISGTVPAAGGPYPSIAAGTPVAVKAGGMVACNAADASTMPCTGIYLGTTLNLVRNAGTSDAFYAGLSPDADLYVAVGGGLTSTPPAPVPGRVSQRVGKAQTSTSVWVDLGEPTYL